MKDRNEKTIQKGPPNDTSPQLKSKQDKDKIHEKNIQNT